MKLKTLLTQIIKEEVGKSLIENITDNLKWKKSTNGEFIQYDFTDNGNYIGNINLRLKKGWNQLHIDIKSEYQGKGYAIKMIDKILNEYTYISIPDGRIVNNNMYKVIDKLTKKYNSYRTEFDETVIYTNQANLDDIKKVFG